MLFTKSEMLEMFAAHHDEPLFRPSDNPFASDEWRRHWIEQIAKEDWEFHIVNDIFGDPAMLLYREPRRPHIFRSSANYYTILSPAVPAELPGPAVELRPLDVASHEVLALWGLLASAGWYVRKSPAHGNWYLPCEGIDFDEYLAARSSQLRNTLKRKGRKFPGTIELCSGGDGLERAISAYQNVYTKSWKQKEPYPAFVPGWIRICAQRGWLRLATAWIGETPIAAQLWFIYAGRAHVYKLAYDEEYREHSAGTILTAHLLQHVLEVDRVKEVDYGSGDDAYKRDWMSHRRERIVLTGIDQSSPRGKLRAARERLAVVSAPLRRLVSRTIPVTAICPLIP